VPAAAFAPAKAAQRGSPDRWRVLWPSGIHVALIIVDGVVDLPTRQAMPGKPDVHSSIRMVSPRSFQLMRQERWREFRQEARPYAEKW
jgi:hypothetical protein